VVVGAVRPEAVLERTAAVIGAAPAAGTSTTSSATRATNAKRPGALALARAWQQRRWMMMRQMLLLLLLLLWLRRQALRLKLVKMRERPKALAQ
jgi:hypothetical protein